MKKRSIVSLLLALMMLLCITPVLAEEPVTIHVYGLGATIPETDPVLPELGNRLGLKIVVDTAAGGADAATGLMTRMMDNDPVSFNDILQVRIQSCFRILIQKLMGRRNRMDHEVADFY